jgi:hypothetical protein
MASKSSLVVEIVCVGSQSICESNGIESTSGNFKFYRNSAPFFRFGRTKSISISNARFRASKQNQLQSWRREAWEQFEAGLAGEKERGIDSDGGELYSHRHSIENVGTKDT